MAHALVLGAALVAGTIFGIGLISPLTPSEGCPSAADLSLFTGLPIVLASAAAAYAVHPLEKGLLFAAALAIAGATVFLLHRIGCLH